MPPSNETPVARSSSGITATVLLIATFLVGIFGGIVADRFLLFREHRLIPRHGARFVSQRVLQRLDHELDLTAAQRESIRRILERRQHAIESAWSGIQPRVREEIRRTDQEIDATLTPAQKTKFQKLRARWEEHARQFGPR